jgi:hypothetical protein
MKYHYIAQVKAGAFAKGLHCGSEVSLQTYDSLEELVQALEAKGEIKKGAWIVDARNVKLNLAIKQVLEGPSCQCGKIDRERNKLWKRAYQYASPRQMAREWHAIGASVKQWN